MQYHFSKTKPTKAILIIICSMGNSTPMLYVTLL